MKFKPDFINKNRRHKIPVEQWHNNHFIITYSCEIPYGIYKGKQAYGEHCYISMYDHRRPGSIGVWTVNVGRIVLCVSRKSATGYVKSSADK